MTDPQQLLNFNHADSVRKELDAKIEKRVTTTLFCWVLSGLATAVLSIAAVAFTQLYEMHGKISEIETRVTILEVKHEH